MSPASEVYIEATETDPSLRARSAVEGAHRLLLDRLTALASAGTAEGGTAETLTDFCAGQLRRLLLTADQTLYAAASGAAETRLLVRALRTGSATIAEHAEALAAAPGGPERANAARALAGMLTLHLGTERAVLLPALAALRGVDLPTLVADFTTLLDGGHIEHPAVIDVREIPHGQRHPRIFTRFARLAPGESFTLVNNHDPKPLRREFEAAHPGLFTWDYLESGPERWQVRIGRVEGVTGDAR